jgi:DNA mismatch repair protein MutL
VRKAYNELLSRDNYPSWFLFLEIDPVQIDINIHPTKTEIKFRDERTVYAIVHAAVRRALGRHNLTPSLDFEPEPAIMSAFAGMPSVPVVAPVTTWRPNDIGQASSPTGWQRLFDLPNDAPVKQHDTDLPGTAPEPRIIPMRELDEWSGGRAVFQLHGRYILAQLKSGFVVVDQQRAHERIVYEQALRTLERGSGPSQALLFPVTLELNAADHALLLSIMPDLKALGFDLEPLSGRSIVVNGMPAEGANDDAGRLLDQLLEQVKNERGSLKAERHATLARSMARSMSHGTGTVLNEAGMHDLIDRLFGCEMPYFSPGGKPVLITYGLKELDERFER